MCLGAIKKKGMRRNKDNCYLLHFDKRKMHFGSPPGSGCIISSAFARVVPADVSLLVSYVKEQNEKERIIGDMYLTKPYTGVLCS